MQAARDYDRTLISLALAVLGTALLSGRAHAQSEAQAEPMLDRYGGMASGPLAPAPTPPAGPRQVQARPLALRGSFAAPRPMAGGGLSWSGKTYAAPAYAAATPRFEPPAQAWTALPAQGPQPRRERRAARDRFATAPGGYVDRRRPHPEAGFSEAAKGPQAPVARAQGAPDAPRGRSERPLPTSIYAPRPTAAAQAPAAPMPAPYRSAQSYGGGSVRHYSVHREFGIRPDPTPIPPQFFTATADLSAGDADAQPLARNTPAAVAAGRTGRTRAAVPATAADPS